MSSDACQACGWEPAEGELWPTLGGVAVRWVEDMCICGEGDWFGTLLKLRLDQKQFLYRWYEHCPRCDQWHYDEGLRGAATGDGKTQLVAAIVLLEFAGPPGIAVPSPNIPIAAASFEQADLLFSAVATMAGGRDDMVKESPLCGFFDVFDTEIKFRDGRPGRIFRVAAVAGTNEGGLPTLFVCDELHEWGDVGSTRARVKTVIGKSTNKRRTPRGNGRTLSLSTAGFDIERSLLGALVKRGRRAVADAATAPRFLFDWREAPDHLDLRKPGDRELAVRAASGAADVLWNVRDRVNAWGNADMPAHEWERYYANRWVNVAEESWLKEHPGAWGRCQGEWTSDPEVNPWLLAVDMSLKHDSTSVARIELLPDETTAITARIWRAHDHQGRIPHDEVWKYIRSEARGGGFRGVVYDPRYFEVPARMLEDEGVLAIEFTQSPERLSPACGLMLRKIVNGELVHDGDPDLTEHVVAAVAAPLERGGFVLKKGKSKGHIDACIAAVMGTWVIHEVPEMTNDPIVMWGD